MSGLILIGVMVLMVFVVFYGMLNDKSKVFVVGGNYIFTIAFSWLCMSAIIASTTVSYYEQIESKYIKELNKNCYVFRDEIYTTSKPGIVVIPIYSDQALGIKLFQSKIGDHKLLNGD
jgi:hypothetical protein